MPLAAYPDLGLFLRAARILPVAIAALAGGVVGGIVVFAINGALAPPPRPDLSTNGHATAAVAPGKPVATVGATTPNPATAQPPAAAAPPAPTQIQPPPQTQIQTPPAVPAVPVVTTAQTTPQDEPRPTRWPNALMRGRKVITPLPPPVIAPAPGDADEEKSAQTDHKSSGGAAASADDDRAAARRHAHASRKHEREFSSNTGARQAGDHAYNRFYDYYDGGRRRATIRGQRPQWTQPAEAAQPWSGQFWGGGGYYRDGQ
jgi:outer membrane biosynthesis protein TonB